MKSQSAQIAIGEVKRALNEHNSDFKSEIFAGISGGADSLALAITLSKCQLKNGWNALIIDHKLQKGSDKVAAKTASICEKLGAKTVKIIEVDVNTSQNSSIEAAARVARFNAFAQQMSTFQNPILLLAHTIDDQAESVLLSIARGSGLSALSAIKECNEFNLIAGSTFRAIRPFLSMTRVNTEDICNAEQVEYFIDPTNKGGENDPIRSQLRSKVMPELKKLFPGINANLSRTAKIAAAAEITIESAFTQNKTDLPISKLPDYLRWLAIREMAKDAINGDENQQISIERIWEVDNTLILMKNGSGTNVELENNIIFRREKIGNKLILVCYNKDKRVNERLIK